jgi:hypothetical protein
MNPVHWNNIESTKISQSLINNLLVMIANPYFNISLLDESQPKISALAIDLTMVS